MSSPFQRVGINPGVPTSLKRKTKEGHEEEEEVHIPINYSFKDLVTHRNSPQDLHFLKAINVVLNPGDCVHIPAYWWYQIQTVTPRKPRKDAPEEPKQKFMEDVRKLSVAIDFWYDVQSVQLDTIFKGIETGKLS
mmetsp:Transcript_15888/g.24469  ORF Transcript_15888/g.24469 Transcript_15888/m.24469 type:complete len:135 (+) Transcript_15888:1197-1601(+)